jgi:hypothetical protein
MDSLIDHHPAALSAPECRFDASKPATARVYNYLLGGKDNFAADREQAQRLTRIYPLLPLHARESRLFLGKAVRWLAGKGIRQFIDAGCGLPAGMPAMPATHHVAQAVDPSCRVAYVDNDPVVVSHASALLAKDPGVAAFGGDLAEPGRILGDQTMRNVIDLSQPAAVILALVLDFFDAGRARGIVASFAEALAAGSYMVVSVGCWDRKTGDKLTAEFRQAALHNHSPRQIAGFLGGLEMVDPPGLCDARHWRACRPVPPPGPAAGHVLAAAARKA